MTGNKRAEGFTLLEMLITVALFSMIVVMMAQTFASFNALQRRLANRSVLTQDMRFATEFIVRVARTNAVSYDPPPQLQAEEVQLVGQAGNRIIIRRLPPSDPACVGPVAVSCLGYSSDSGVTWASLTGERVNVDRFTVYVRPTASPFVLVGNEYPSNVQPFVTFSLKFTYLSAHGSPTENRATLDSQATVSSRVYQR